MSYQINLNLQQRAALRIALSCWEKKDVQDRIAVIIESCGQFDSKKLKNEWKELIRTVIDEENKELLPQHLQMELTHIVKMIGEKILAWFQHIKHEYSPQKTISGINKICWTFYGTIDDVKIFKLFWLKNSHLDITELYNFACSHMLEKHIDDLWSKIPIDMQNVFHRDIYQHFDKHLSAYWKHCRDRDLSNLIRHFQNAANNNQLDIDEFRLIYNLNHSIEENMLKLSVHQGYFIATKYFWEKLTEQERNDIVLPCTRISVRRFKFLVDHNKGINYYKKSQYIEISLFLINQMSDQHKIVFFNERLELKIINRYFIEKITTKSIFLEMLLFTWPWQELFIPALKDMFQYQKEIGQMVCEVLNVITQKIRIEHDLNYHLGKGKYRSLLREAWFIIPASVKQDILKYDYLFNFVGFLIRVWDMDSLKLILNDKAVATSRDKLIESGFDSYEELILGDEFEKLDQLMEAIFLSEEEKQSIKQKIDVWSCLVIKNRFDLVDKLLDWKSSTPDERLSIKNNVDHIEICDEIINLNDEEQYLEVLNKFLDWKFDTEEEKRDCKNHFKNDDDFLIRKIVLIWYLYRNDVEKAQMESSDFLHWVMEFNEDIIRFKKNIITKFETDPFMMRHVVCLRGTGNIHDFEIWCLINDEES